METLGLTEVARACNSSKNYVTQAIQEGKLKASLEQRKTIKVWRIGKKELARFMRVHVTGNARVGRKNKETSGTGIAIKRGYRLIKLPQHHRADSDGYVPEHIIVMEQHLQRPIIKGEIVHHIDRNRLNNSIENLGILASHSEHMKECHAFSTYVETKIRHRPELQTKIRELIENYEALKTI